MNDALMYNQQMTVREYLMNVLSEVHTLNIVGPGNG